MRGEGLVPVLHGGAKDEDKHKAPSRPRIRPLSLHGKGVGTGGRVDEGRGPCAQYISLKDPLTSLKSKRIKQVNKIQKLILRLKGLRWRHITLLGLILVVDLLELPAVDPKATWWKEDACHLV